MMKHSLSLTGIIMVICTHAWAQAPQLPSPPSWIKKVLSQPEWWLRVEAGYNSNTEVSNRWAKLKQMEETIDRAVRSGTPVTYERQKLIKYLTLFTQSLPPNARRGLTLEIAEVYDELGDYQTGAAKHLEIVTAHPDYELSLHALAS